MSPYHHTNPEQEEDKMKQLYKAYLGRIFTEPLFEGSLEDCQKFAEEHLKSELDWMCAKIEREESCACEEEEGVLPSCEEVHSDPIFENGKDTDEQYIIKE